MTVLGLDFAAYYFRRTRSSFNVIPSCVQRLAVSSPSSLGFDNHEVLPALNFTAARCLGFG